MKATMSAANNAKPPRPCTEYNIFFQLERAYILQEALRIEPAVEGETFHTSQPSYAGLPALPRRYASLVLPYDWFLPGKEKRRKRKHRKSHGAIGFHELSTEIANAWKSVDDEVKTYCSQVCAAGVIRYKASLTEWKRKGGLHDPKERSRKMVKMVSDTSLSRDQAENITVCEDVTKVVPEAVASNENTSSVHIQDLILRDAPGDDAPIPTISLSQGGSTMKDMNKAFEDEIVAMGDEEILGLWDMQAEPLFDLPLEEIASSDQSPNTAATRGVNNDQNGDVAQRNLSVVSNEPVDMADSEILNIWNETDPSTGIEEKYCLDCSQTNAADEKYSSVFGGKGYAQTMADVQQLFQQMKHIEAVRRRPARRLSVVACSA
jgi:hypothetical protein